MVNISKKIKSDAIKTVEGIRMKKNRLKDISTLSAKIKPKSGSLKPRKKPLPLYNELILSTEFFINDLECIKEMFSIVIPVLEEKDEKRKRKIEDSVANLHRFRGAGPKSKEKEQIINVIYKVLDNIKKINRANVMFRSNSIVLVVTRFDEFLSDILKVSFKAAPDKFKITDKTLSYDEVLEHKSLEKVQAFFINREVDKLLRTSHGGTCPPKTVPLVIRMGL